MLHDDRTGGGEGRGRGRSRRRRRRDDTVSWMRGELGCSREASMGERGCEGGGWRSRWTMMDLRVSRSV